MELNLLDMLCRLKNLNELNQGQFDVLCALLARIDGLDELVDTKISLGSPIGEEIIARIEKLEKRIDSPLAKSGKPVGGMVSVQCDCGKWIELNTPIKLAISST